LDPKFNLAGLLTFIWRYRAQLYYVR